MPVTPYHFGPGLLIKSAAPGRISVLAFAATQVVIDLETGYHMLRHEWPLHRVMHSFLLSTVIGVAVGMALVRLAQHRRGGRVEEDPETALKPAVLGGALGGAIHPLLDGIMHTDVRPFWPMSDANPLQGFIGVSQLETMCVLCGVAGGAILLLRARRTKHAVSA